MQIFKHQTLFNMLNAKETLKKIADALNVATEEPKAEETVETTEPVAEAGATPVEETTEVVAETETTEVTEEVKEVEVEKEVEVKEEVNADDNRLKALEDQLETLKDILANSFVQEQKAEQEAPKLPTEEPKGITHSPEKPVNTKANGLGRKGDNIKSRVWKYINNQ